MTPRFTAALAAVLAAGAAFAQQPTAATPAPDLVASLSIRETVTFVNAAPGPVHFSVSAGKGPWKTVSLPSGASQRYECTGCSAFKAAITTGYQGRVIKRVEQPLESGFVYEIYYEERYATKFYAFRKARRT